MWTSWKETQKLIIWTMASSLNRLFEGKSFLKVNEIIDFLG